MSRPTMVMRPNMHEITARGHQARVMAFSPKSWKTGGLIQFGLFIHVNSCELHCDQLVTKPGQWPLSKIKIR